MRTFDNSSPTPEKPFALITVPFAQAGQLDADLERTLTDLLKEQRGQNAVYDSHHIDSEKDDSDIKQGVVTYKVYYHKT